MTPEDLVVGTMHGGSIGRHLRHAAKQAVPAAMSLLQIGRLASGNKYMMDPRIDAGLLVGHHVSQLL